MNKAELQAAVIELVAAHFDCCPDNPDEVTPETRFIEDLEADSLDAIELVMAAEDRFEVSLPDEDAEKILTVRQMIDTLAAKLGVSGG